jgi:hypothetical protein
MSVKLADPQFVALRAPAEKGSPELVCTMLLDSRSACTFVFFDVEANRAASDGTEEVDMIVRSVLAERSKG